MPSVSKAASRGGGAGGSPQTEQPTHYTYLKEFRTEQCPLFLQHKCAQHRPFTCFHWHFLNQRRRRPIRRRDGTFNYSPDVYCAKYDETTGICPDGDEFACCSVPESCLELAFIQCFRSLRPNSDTRLPQSHWIASLKRAVCFWRTSSVTGLFRQQNVQ